MITSLALILIFLFYFYFFCVVTKIFYSSNAIVTVFYIFVLHTKFIILYQWTDSRRIKKTIFLNVHWFFLFKNWVSKYWIFQKNLLYFLFIYFCIYYYFSFFNFENFGNLSYLKILSLNFEFDENFEVFWKSRVIWIFWSWKYFLIF